LSARRFAPCQHFSQVVSEPRHERNPLPRAAVPPARQGEAREGKADLLTSEGL